MSQSTPSDKTELKPQMSPQCPFCESLGVGYKTIANKHGDQRIQAVCLSCDARGPSCDNESLSYELFDIRSELSKSSETPMSKEEPIEYKKEYNAFCPACGTYGHTSGDCQKIQKGLSSPNPLPSSPSTDKEKTAGILHHESRIRELQVENEQLKEKLRIKEECYHESFNRNVFATIEISRLKQELCEYEPMEKWSKLCEEWADKCASLQSVVEAKDEALKQIAGLSQQTCSSFESQSFDATRIARDALHIDQSGGKKEEPGTYKVLFDESLRTPSATPVSSHVGTKEPTWISVKDSTPKLDGEFSDYVLVWNGKDQAIGYYNDLHYWMTHSDEYSDSGITHWMPLPEPPKPREDTTSTEAPLNSKKSVSASSTAISTEEGKE